MNEKKNIPVPDLRDMEEKIWNAVDRIYKDYLKEGYDHDATSPLVAMLTIKVGGFAMGLITRASLQGAIKALEAANEIVQVGITQGMQCQARHNPSLDIPVPADTNAN